jgi:hypothetical protein
MPVESQKIILSFESRTSRKAQCHAQKVNDLVHGRKERRVCQAREESKCVCVGLACERNAGVCKVRLVIHWHSHNLSGYYSWTTQSQSAMSSWQAQKVFCNSIRLSLLSGESYLAALSQRSYEA